MAKRNGVVAEADDIAGGAGDAEEGGSALLLEGGGDLPANDRAQKQITALVTETNEAVQILRMARE